MPTGRRRKNNWLRGQRLMLDTMTAAREITIDHDEEVVARMVHRIRDCHGVAEATFSKRPLSLYRSLERRRSNRTPLDVPVYLYPAGEVEGRVQADWQAAAIAVTRDISEHGVGWRHDVRLNCSHVLAEFDLFGEGPVLMLIEVRWQQRKARHSYIAGGRIVGVAMFSDQHADTRH
jgi:hypothetical protein